ncbi:MAG TPA: type IV secretory system conjugative DNA transfer family protein [Acidimicrobiales bacterium]
MNSLVEVAAAVVVVAGWRLSDTNGRRRGAGPGPPGVRRRRVRTGPRRAGAFEPARWATRRDVRALVVDAPRPGRLTLGTAQRRLLAAEPGHSVLVVGPTQSRKTSGFAIPAILEWEGPVVAASVKSDLARHTLAWRRNQGRVWVYDPSASTGLATAAWSPLQASVTWEGARRTAASLTEVARSAPGALADGDFWYATASKLLAPLLFAAATTGGTMADVVRWVDTQEVDEVFDALTVSGARPALQAARATWGRDDRQRSAVYTTTETIVEVFADPAVAASESVPEGTDGGGRIDPGAMLDGGDTLYLCAPAHDQRRLRPLFATLVSQVVEAAYERSGRRGAPLDPPLLVVLDEAANVAPLAELDVLASTAAGHGVQLVTVWQDLAQLQARYGTRSGSVVNNHRVKVFLSGIADPGTLEHASSLIGETEHQTWATTVDGGGAVSRTDSASLRRLAPADALRRVPPGDAVVVSGHLPPIRLRLRPWQGDRRLCTRAETAADASADTAASRGW